MSLKFLDFFVALSLFKINELFQEHLKVVVDHSALEVGNFDILLLEFFSWFLGFLEITEYNDYFWLVLNSELLSDLLGGVLIVEEEEFLLIVLFVRECSEGEW